MSIPALFPTVFEEADKNAPKEPKMGFSFVEKAAKEYSFDALNTPKCYEGAISTLGVVMKMDVSTLELSIKGSGFHLS